MKKLFLFNILACLFALQGLAQTFTYQDENGTTWGCEVINSNPREVSITSASDYGKEVVIPGVVNDGENEYEVTQLGSELFYNSIVTKVTLPKSLRVLDAKAFYGCSDLQSVDLSSCEEIGYQAFSKCPKLSVILGASCLKLGGEAFDPCATLFAPLSYAGFYKNASGLYDTSLDCIYSEWEKYQNQITYIDDIMEISSNALDDKSGIENVIGATEVSKVTGLKVTGTINSYDIFIIRTKMYNLHYLDLSDADIVACDFPYYGSYCTSDNEVGAYAFCDLDNLISLKLPKNATVIGGDAVRECSNLCEVILPEKLEGIGTHSFLECKKLVSIPFPPHLRGIGDFAFYWCESLRNVSFPHNLQSIGYNAFDLCRSLTEVRFPSSIQSVENNAFVDCPIKKVYTYTIEPIKIDQKAFSSDTYSTAELWMPTQSYSNYYYNTQWGQFRNDKYHWFDEPYEYFYVNNDYTLYKGNSADGDKGRFDGTPDVDVNPGGGLIVEGEGDQGAGDVHLKGDGKNWASIIAHANMDAKRLYLDITVKANCWHFFCFPFDVKRSDIRVASCSAIMTER